MMLFLDTEWADDFARELVSLALVGDELQQVFYAERNPPPRDPTDWVGPVVYPRLRRGHCPMRDCELTHALRAFLQRIASSVVCYDNANDLTLLEFALRGFSEIASKDEAPVTYSMRKLCGSSYVDAVETVFRKNPAARTG
jgi:hypothetical protein